MNGLDIFIIACVAIGLIQGLFDGFIKQVISFIALLTAIFCAGRLAIPIRAYLLHFISEESISLYILTGLSYILAFVFIVLVIVLGGKMVSLAVKMTPAKPLNMMLGGLFGFALWLLSLSILFNILSSLDKDSQLLSRQTKEKSVFYMKVKEVVPAIYPSIKKYFTAKEIEFIKQEKEEPVLTI